jgi:hypothetical protein
MKAAGYEGDDLLLVSTPNNAGAIFCSELNDIEMPNSAF